MGVANGLDALTLSIEALGLPHGSGIIVQSNTYIATMLVIIRAGHKPVLIVPDICAYNIDPIRLPEMLTRETRAICVTHLFGKTCRIDLICEYAQKYSLHVIEACA